MWLKLWCIFIIFIATFGKLKFYKNIQFVLLLSGIPPVEKCQCFQPIKDKSEINGISRNKSIAYLTFYVIWILSTLGSITSSYPLWNSLLRIDHKWPITWVITNTYTLWLLCHQLGKRISSSLPWTPWYKHCPCPPQSPASPAATCWVRSPCWWSSPSSHQLWSPRTAFPWWTSPRRSWPDSPAQSSWQDIFRKMLINDLKQANTIIIMHLNLVGMGEGFH